MLRATALLSGCGLVAASLAGFGSIGLVLAVFASLANLWGLALLTRFYTGAVQRGEPAAAGLAALHGKTLVLLSGMALMGSLLGFTPVVMGFVLVTTSFTIAAPAVALLNTAPAPVEAL